MRLKQKTTKIGGTAPAKLSFVTFVSFCLKSARRFAARARQRAREARALPDPKAVSALFVSIGVHSWLRVFMERQNRSRLAHSLSGVFTITALSDRTLHELLVDFLTPLQAKFLRFFGFNGKEPRMTRIALMSEVPSEGAENVDRIHRINKMSR